MRRYASGWIIPLIAGLWVSSAAIGIWATPNRTIAWELFGAMAGGALLFILLASFPASWFNRLVWGLLAGACLLSLYFGLSYDWHTNPAEFGLINSLGTRLMAIRPNLALPALDANQAGSILTAVTLLSGFWIIAKYARHNLPGARLAVAATLVCAAGALMSSARAAWLVLPLAAMLSLIAFFLQRRLDNSRSEKNLIALGWGIGVMAFVGLMVLSIFLLPDSGNRVVQDISAHQRSEVAINTLRLVADVPFTGSGLGTFSAMYGTYILVLPFKIFPHGHNLYLDIALEQGVFGLFTWLAIWIVAGRRLFRPYLTTPVRPTSRQWALAGVIGAWLVLFLVGFIEDPFYDPWSRLISLVIPGLALVGSQKISSIQTKPASPPQRLKSRWTRIVGSGLIVVAALAGWLSNAVQSAWYSNLGSLTANRIQLAGFPSGKWQAAPLTEEFMPARSVLNQAVQLNPRNRTAQHQLGLIALQKGDYPAAISRLEIALQLDPGHRGVQKNLGYSYVWAGEFEKASPLLAALPETRGELHVYSGWWNAHDRPELAENARQMANQLSPIDQDHSKDGGQQ